MNTRAKTFDATGIAPGGRLFAGDLNLIQDVVAAMVDYTQNIGVQTIMVGDSSLIVAKFGTGEISMSAHVRTSGIARGLGGIFAGNFTTTTRDAIAAGSRPTSLIIYNTTNARFEYNSGSDATPVWSPIAATTSTGSISSGTLGSRPTPAASGPNTWYWATDVVGGTLYFSNGSVWTAVTPGMTAAPIAHASTHHPQTGSDRIVMSLTATAASRPAANAVVAGTLFLASDTGAFSRSDGASTWTAITSSGVSAHASTHLAGGSDAISWITIHNQGTLAARPAAGSTNAGYIYLATDTAGGTAYLSNGSTWTQIAASVTLPGATYIYLRNDTSANPNASSGVIAEYASPFNCSFTIATTGVYSVRFGAQGQGNPGGSSSATHLGINGSSTGYYVGYNNGDGTNSATEVVLTLTAGQRLHLMHQDNDGSRPINSAFRYLMVQKL